MKVPRKVTQSQKIFGRESKWNTNDPRYLLMDMKSDADPPQSPVGMLANRIYSAGQDSNQ